VSGTRGRGGGPDIMWSPWRMAYVSAEHGGEHDGPSCVFCDLAARDDDDRTYILHRGERAFVIMNLYPYNNGHLMIVPYAHVDALRSLDGASTSEMMALA
jgi:ATP adenylyltransferase